MAKGPPPSDPPVLAPAESLGAMNDNAAQGGGAQGGVLPCKKKSWFAFNVKLVDDEDKSETFLKEISVDLNLTDLGDVQKKVADNKGVRIQQLEPGGKGKVLKITHDTNVYEALGDIA